MASHDGLFFDSLITLVDKAVSNVSLKEGLRTVMLSEVAVPTPLAEYETWHS